MAEQLTLFAPATTVTWYCLRWITPDENYGVEFLRSTHPKMVTNDDPMVLSGEAEFYVRTEASRG